MKAPAVLTNHTTRKEAKERKVTMLFRRKREQDEHDEMSRGGRALIYLCKDRSEEGQPFEGVPSIDQQRELCREAARALAANVVGEFTDEQSSHPRPGLQQVLQLICSYPGIDRLIVTSRDRLATDIDQAFDIGLCLGFYRTVVVTIHRESPVEGATEPSRN